MGEWEGSEGGRGEEREGEKIKGRKEKGTPKVGSHSRCPKS